MRSFISHRTVQLVCIQLYTILKCFNNVKVAKGEQYMKKLFALLLSALRSRKTYACLFCKNVVKI